MTSPTGSGYGRPRRMPWANWSTRTRLIVGGVLALLVLGALFGKDPQPPQPLELRPAATSSQQPAATLAQQPVDTPAEEPEVIVTQTVTVEPSPSETPAPATTAPPKVTVPDVRGLDGATAEQRLHEAGFTTVRFMSVDGHSVLAKSAWNVIAQGPVVGDPVDPATEILLQVARPQPTPEPVRTPKTTAPQPTRQPQQPPATTAAPTQQPEATDPRFGTCREANDNGYGDYVKGRDPEYNWYDDRDHDGTVCERS